MESTARVIRWNAKSDAAREQPRGGGTPVLAAELAPMPAGQLGPLDGLTIMIPDEQLEALGTIFAASPLRKAMTFEGYLVVKGFGYPIV